MPRPHPTRLPLDSYSEQLERQRRDERRAEHIGMILGVGLRLAFFATIAAAAVVFIVKSI